MGQNDHFEDDGGFSDFLQELVRSGRLEGAAEGITKLVIDKGLDSLSSKQRFVFERDIIGMYVREECSRCASNIPWSEMFASIDNGGLCGYCWHMQQRLDRE